MKTHITPRSLLWKSGMFLLLLGAGIFCSSSTSLPAPAVLNSPELAISQGSKIAVFSTATWSVSKELSLKEVVDMAYSKNGKFLALGDCYHNDVVKLETGSYCQSSVPLDSDRGPAKVAFCPDNKQIAAAVVDRGLFLISGTGSSQSKPIDYVNGLAFNPEGNRIAAGTKTSFQVWKTAPFERTVYKKNYPVTCLAYSTNGKQVYVGKGDGWRVLNTANYEEEKRFTGEAVRAIAADETGKWIAVVHPAKAIIYSAATFKKVKEFLFAQPVTLKDAKFSTNGNWLAIAQSANSVHVYTTFQWRNVKSLPFNGTFRAFAFRPGVLELMPKELTTKIYLVRHAERTAGDDLTDTGYARAKILADTLEEKRISEVLTTDTKRTFETAKPTANRYCYVDPKYYQEDTIVSYLKRQWNRNFLVVSHSGSISHLVQQFGLTPTFEDTPDIFDNLIIITRKKVNNNITTTHIETKYGPSSSKKAAVGTMNRGNSTDR